MLDVQAPKEEAIALNLEKRSQAWLDNSPVCTKIIDPDFNLLYMSCAGIRALKIDNIDQYYGKPFPLKFYPESFKSTIHEKLQIVRDIGKVQVHEGSLISADGKILWFESTLSPVYTDEGELDYIMVVSLEISKRKQAEAKDTLLKEIHHRIKNNLQIVSSLLSLQSNEIDDREVKRIILNSQQRISAISLVHEKIYQTDNLDGIYVREYIESLISNISSTCSGDNFQFKKDVQIDDFKLNMDLLVPCSLILNEIITNIFKYGFESNHKPILFIRVLKKGNEIIMSIADNGHGIDQDKKEKNSSSLGMKLIESLAVQIKADVDVVSTTNGVRYTIRFNV